jgi:hypothetical protein
MSNSVSEIVIIADGSAEPGDVLTAASWLQRIHALSNHLDELFVAEPLLAERSAGLELSGSSVRMATLQMATYLIDPFESLMIIPAHGWIADHFCILEGCGLFVLDRGSLHYRLAVPETVTPEMVRHSILRLRESASGGRHPQRIIACLRADQLPKDLQRDPAVA